MAARAVLVTRPAGQGAALAQALERRGLRAVQQPLLELHALPELPATRRRLVLELDQYQHVVFISSNAVRFGMDLVQDFWPQLPVGINWYAVGAATAAQLERFGVEALTPGIDMTSEGLLRLPQLQQLTGQRLLIVKGEGGRTLLREELRRRGARVDQLACYTRGCPRLASGALATRLADAHVELVMISSGEGLANMLALLSPQETTKLQQMSLLVPSARVAQAAEAAGFERVLVARNASDEAMLDALEHWQAGTGDPR